MNGNREALSLMDELASAGFGAAKGDFTASQEDFTDTTYTDPVARLNFSDMEDTTGFNENHLVASTPFVIPGRVPIEYDDVTVDSDALKGFTQKLLQPPMSFQDDNKPVPQSNGNNPSSNEDIGLNLEQELQQALQQNGSAGVTDKDGSLTESDLDINKDLVSPCSNVGLNLEQELQQALQQNGSAGVTDKDGSLTESDLDINKDLVSPCSNVGLNLEQELQQAVSQNDDMDVSKNVCPVKCDPDISKDAVFPCGNVGLSLEQELQQAVSQNDVKSDLDVSQDLVSPRSNVRSSLMQELQQSISQNVNDYINESPLKSDLNLSKDKIPSTDVVTLETQNESLNQQEDLEELDKMSPANEKSIKLENKMEISAPGEILDLKQELELADSSSSNDDKNDLEVFDNEENTSEPNCISPECPRENNISNITKTGCTSMKDNNNGDASEVLNTMEYLGLSSERLKSFSDSNTSSMSDNSPVHLKKSDDDEHVNTSSVENKNDSVAVCNKRSLETEPSPYLTTDASPEKITKLDSETSSQENSLEQNESPENCPSKFESSNYAQLKKQVELLEEQLKNEQNLKTRAAELGMQILEENGVLKDKVENLLRKIAASEEDRENERHATKLRFQNKDYMEQQYSEEISHLKEEISKVKNDNEAVEKEKTTLTRQMKSMEYAAEQSQLKEQQLTSTIGHLEKLLQQKTDQAIHNASVMDNTDDGDMEQITALQQEIVELQNSDTLLKSQLISQEANVKRLEEELNLSNQRKSEKDQEIDEMKCEMNSYHKTLDVAQTEILDLKAQLHAARIENVGRKDRGNSLFSEIEDRRVLSEKMVATLQRNYQALKERYDVEKQQHHKLKMQAVSFLNMNSGQVSEDYERQLNSMLTQARNESKELQEKLRHYQKNEIQQTENMFKMQASLGTNENKDSIELLNSLNEIKEKELNEVKKNLNDMEMQYLQEQNKVVDYIKKLRLTEEETHTLRCTNMKLKLQIEELMMKYTPDELSEEKLSKKTHVEKIPLGPTENIAKSLMNQKTRHQVTQSKGPVENQPKTRAQKIAELVRCGALNPVDALKESPKAKKTVSLSSEVTLIDNEGKKEEKKVNMVDENVPAKLERRRAPKGKIASPSKIIEVKSPVHGRRADCKQQ